LLVLIACVVFDAAGSDVADGCVFAAAVVAAAGVAIGAVVFDVVGSSAAGVGALDPAACGAARTLAGVLLGDAMDDEIAGTALVVVADGQRLFAALPLGLRSHRRRLRGLARYRRGSVMPRERGNLFAVLLPR